MYYKACTKHFPVILFTTKLAQSTSQYYFVLQSLHKLLPSTTLYYKACTNYFTVLLCTTKLAQNTFQYDFVLQSLHKTRPSTTLYYKACTKHFPVLLCTTKLAQTTSQYYFVLQSLHKTLPSTTLYYKACTKHQYYCVLQKLAQTTSQYYFVLQSLHKIRSSTTLYYKACTKHFPVLFCTAKLAQSTSQYYCVLQSLHKLLPSNTVTKQPYAHRRHSNKKTILKHFLKRVLKGKLLAPKLRKSADKSLSQPGCSHSNTIYEIQLQKTISITYAAAAHELQITIEHNRTMRNDVGNYSSKTGISTPKRKKDDFEALF